MSAGACAPTASARAAARAAISPQSAAGDGVFWYALMATMVLIDGCRSGGICAPGGDRRDRVDALPLAQALDARPRPFASDLRIHSCGAAGRIQFFRPAYLACGRLHSVALAHYPMLAWLLIPSPPASPVRVVLGLHYPSDVLAATAIGTALAGCRCGRSRESLYLRDASRRSGFSRELWAHRFIGSSR